MKEIQFGVRVPNSGPLAAIDNILKTAKEAERMGFDSIWVHDHVVWSSEMHRHHISSGAAEALEETQDANFYESLTTLAFLAAHTEAIRLGIACLVMPCRNPIYAAKQTATLDQLCNGRLIVGVGLGSKASRESKEFEVFGVPLKARARMTDEHIQAMTNIWEQPLASFHGKYIDFTDAEVFPKPVQKPHPPIWVGGWTDKAAERAGKFGDGWIPGWLSPEEMKRGNEVLRRTAEEHGRNPGNITIAVEKLVCIARNREDALEMALPTIQESSQTYERDVDTIQFALDRHIIGSVDDVKRRVGEFVEAGVGHFELKVIYPTIVSHLEQMEMWAKEILPHY